MIVLVAQLHSASSRRITEGLRTLYVLVSSESTVIGTLLLIGGEAHDGLDDMALKIGLDCVDGGFFLRLYLGGKVNVTGEQERVHSSMGQSHRTYQIGEASRAVPQSIYGAAVIRVQLPTSPAFSGV